MNASKAIKTASSEHILVNVGGGNYAINHKTPHGWEMGGTANLMTAVYCRRFAIVKSALCLMGHEIDDVDAAMHAMQNKGIDTSIPELMEASLRRLRASLPQSRNA